MRLYHGTSSKHLDAILKHGLVPRGDRPSNWAAASANDRVYLTDAYGLYFAQSARKEVGEDLVIVEIDTDLLTDQDALHADEDAVWFIYQHGALDERFMPPSAMIDKNEQAMHFSRVLRPMAESGIGYEKSMELLGNCTHEGAIPLSAITNIIRYSAAEGPWWVSFHDPVISILNYRFHGSEYRATQLVVAGRMDEARQVDQPIPGFLDLDAVERMCAPRRTVIDLPNVSHATPSTAPALFGF
ncbi:hypothetical protein [Rhizobium sp. BK176]|uniref:hypothetical protein n=1 Tax=Rhizobium sp. BK176 TaxID=2587071 RepID=UPI00216AB02B|nr:hypothetical protein [Rhizobium sp. BK176]MCS4089576.1 hypothetical protein [Rhizobium sp. BK176]